MKLQTITVGLGVILAISRVEAFPDTYATCEVGPKDIYAYAYTEGNLDYCQQEAIRKAEEQIENEKDELQEEAEAKCQCPRNHNPGPLTCVFSTEPTPLKAEVTTRRGNGETGLGEGDWFMFVSNACKQELISKSNLPPRLLWPMATGVCHRLAWAEPPEGIFGNGVTAAAVVQAKLSGSCGRPCRN